MSAERVTYKKQESNYIVNPKKFTLWVFLVSVTMLFAAFTSAMMVRRAAGNWNYFPIPTEFTVTSIVAILSSIAMQLSYYYAKKDEISKNRIWLFITFVLGVMFLVGQYFGFKALIAERVYAVGNPSGSFFYVITGLHGLHVVGGVIFLINTLIASLKFKVHSRNLIKINLCTTYWHFIGVLWLYLFAILIVLR